MLVLVQFLRWRDVDPATHRFDPTLAAAIAERHVLVAVGGDRSRSAPVGNHKRPDVEHAIDLDLVAAYGAWAAGWRWSASEPGWGGPVRTWCCAADSVLRAGDGGVQATIDRVVASVVDLRGFLEELSTRFDELRAATAGLPIDRGIEHAAAALLPLVLERTSAEDAWYRTFARILGWYLESAGHAPDQLSMIDTVVSGRFHSWSEPDQATATATCEALGDAVGQALADGRVHDAVPAWRKLRGLAFANPSAARPRLPLVDDAHRRFVDSRDRARDPERAARMRAGLELCRASAARGEVLTFDRLAAWQAVVLGVDRAEFRTGPAFARDGRVRYELDHRTRAVFDAALVEAEGGMADVAVRAARAYLDVCFFHPFADGNGRAARLALDHIVTRAGLGLRAVDPIFVIARAADDARGAWCLAYVVETLLGVAPPSATYPLEA